MAKKSDATGIWRFDLSVDPASVAANTTAEQVVTGVTGVKFNATHAEQEDDCIAIIPQTALTAGLSIVGGRVTATDQVTVRYVNNTAAAIDNAAVVLTFTFARY